MSNNNKIKNQYVKPSQLLLLIIFNIGDFTLRVIGYRKKRFYVNAFFLSLLGVDVGGSERKTNI